MSNTTEEIPEEMTQAESAQVINREISWLAFNERVLQEAADPTVPLFERLKFLGIFSNNLDEFYRVRFATVRRIVFYNIKTTEILGGTPKEILEQIRTTTVGQRARFGKIYDEILEGLAKEKVFIINEKELTEEQGRVVGEYFDESIRPVITPIMIDTLDEMPVLTDKHIYLTVKLSNEDGRKKPRYAMIEVPTSVRPRFFVLPKDKDDNRYVMLLDDVIRYNLREIFYLFPFEKYEAYTLKLTKDAELDIDNDVSSSFMEQLSKSLKQRKMANTVRFIYDQKIAPDLLEFIKSKLQFTGQDSVVAGGRYHNFKDFMGFPDLGLKHLKHKKVPALNHCDLKPYKSTFSTISKKDALLHFPYQSFHHITDLLREAAIDPKVKEIYISLYRVARTSAVVNALINAVRNGKKVTVVVELQARFDEENNIYWANKLQEEGANIIHGVKHLKVHCKVLLIGRREKRKMVYYSSVGTGNYNETTAKIYTDHSLLTSDQRITREVKLLFNFFEDNLSLYGHKFKHLIVSPFALRKKMMRMITREMKSAAEGKEAWILLKVNGLIDYGMIKKLYQASQAGVKIRLIVRGVCSLIPGVPGLSDNIEAISIVDKYLEHSRLYLFANGGDPKYFISSADWMTRNLDNRVEVTCPVYDPELQQEIRDVFEIQWKDNVKARINNGPDGNTFKKLKPGEVSHRSQIEIYNYLKHKNELSVK